MGVKGVSYSSGKKKSKRKIKGKKKISSNAQERKVKDRTGTKRDA